MAVGLDDDEVAFRDQVVRRDGQWTFELGSQRRQDAIDKFLSTFADARKSGGANQREAQVFRHPVERSLNVALGDVIKEAKDQLFVFGDTHSLLPSLSSWSGVSDG
jgi:hypothetical protein